MTDRELGFFIGGTLELNVICLTINLQLGRKGWQDSLHMDLKGTAAFSGRKIQEKKFKRAGEAFQGDFGINCVRFGWVEVQEK